MDSESQWIFDRMQLYRLWEAHPEWSLRQYARELGYDVGWVRKWLKRFQSAVNEGFQKFLSRSRAPHTCPHRTSEAVKQVLGELREQLRERYHRPAGRRTILHELLKREDVQAAGYVVPNSASRSLDSKRTKRGGKVLQVFDLL